MASLFTPKFKHNVARIVPFGLIWLLIGWMFSISEELLPQSMNNQSSTNIDMTLPVFLFAAFSLTFLGLLVGTMETLIYQKRFVGYSFLRKISIKFLIYMAMMLLTIAITYPTALAIDTKSSFADPALWNQTGIFLLSPLFFNALFQLSFSLFICLLYSAISEHLGHNVLLNFYTGKYHKPVVEKRIFMFLDMKDSTAIAEKLGHVQYFKLLGEYYEMMSDPIINHLGEVYQYIGDEVVVTWKSSQGFENNNCVKCFYAIKKNLELKHDHFNKQFGVIPDFKAGIHVGETTVGEIGALKKEIVFVGDVLNTTARIQGMCNEHNSELIISDDLRSGLDEKSVDTHSLGDIRLKGKMGRTTLFSVNKMLQ
jgi:adenylate cyclase